MDRGVVSSYSRHNSFHGVTKSSNYMPGEQVETYSRHNRHPDHTALDVEETARDDSERSGRKSDDNADNLAIEDKKAKKRKLKKFRSFMQVFLGGLQRHQSLEQKLQGENSGIHYQQKLVQLDPPLKCHYPSDCYTSSVDIPGLCGLHNHGNTCFMNAILQCLSNTDQLAEYFVTDQYKNDFNRQRLSSHNSSGQGDVTEQFAILLKCLWNGQYDSRVTGKFKEVIGKHALQYQGASQHDAQEFFLWLLDSVHEDLNQAGKKKYRPIKDSAGRPDEEVAAETLQSHMKRNNSFIQNLFQGQFRSGVTCPSCGTRSATFDPYVCVSLPLPQREKRPIYVTTVYRSSTRRNCVFGVNMCIDSTIRDLRNSLAELCGVNRYHLVLTDLHPNGFNRTFYDDQHLSVINSGDMVFSFECPPYRGDNPEAITRANPSGSKELMLILVINKLGQTQFGKRFGPPLILRIWRDLTHSQFQSVVLKAMVDYMREGVRLADVCRSGIIFRCRVMDGLPGRCVLPTDADHPFYSPSIDKALHVSMLYGGPAHVKLVAEWEPEIKARVFGVVPDQIPEPHQSVHDLRQIYQQPLNATLNDCLKIYTKEETLNREDSWFCPHCRHQQQDATKKITLWTLPDVLVIHLKRFRQIGYCRTKLNTLVSFPIQGLDMTPFLAPRSSQRPTSATLQRRILVSDTRNKTFPSSSKSVRFEEDPSAGKNVNRSIGTKENKFHFPWKKKKKEDRRNARLGEMAFTPGLCDSPSSIRSAPSALGHGVSRGRRLHSPVHSLDGNDMRSRSPASLDPISADNVYDLYAVCNHHGTLMQGHYTAFCRNPADGHWYVFDDSQVQPLAEEQLVTPGAYLLFYVRQSLLNQFPPLSSGSSSSSSSGSSSHWAMRIPRFKLELNESTCSSEGVHSPNVNDTNKTSFSQPSSITSAISAPAANTGSRGISPQSTSHDNGSDVFLHSRSTADGSSVVGLQPPRLHTSLHHHQMSPSHPTYNQSPYSTQSNSHQALGGRHASLRIGRRQLHSESLALAADEQFLKRGTSFHGSHYHDAVQRSLTNPERVLEMPPHPAYPSSGQSLYMPSRSIPNITADFPPTHDHPYPLPSRSIPNISAPHMSPPTSARVLIPRDYAVHFMSPQPHRTRNAASRSLSGGQNTNPPGTESCV